MDALSALSSIGGYRAVLEAATKLPKFFPLLTTAAGTVRPSNVLILGAGVAGLQAIATAKRLGAIVSATDVRPATKEQVESLGGAFIAVEDEEFAAAQTSGGYAREMSPEYQKKQAALIAQTIAKQDIVICTALIPGRPAPELISNAMVKSMKPGSVIVDLAVEAGGNCAASRPGKVIVKHGVKIVGHANVPGRIADDASRLFSRNLLSFLTPMIDSETGTLNIDYDDEIIAGTLVTRDGAVVHEAIRQAEPKPAKAPAEIQEHVDGNG
ncbi:MAG: NAD(P) transhydrogenase subunit alpha part 1 [Alphaproteobacteria bacterium MarineAlpha10_Bin3]|nr:MAG: NAD(P) transhydrogenase subunit alpha part 1 [Alphaproteobacteria bacterium MarineAlpha10_Bin3]PPR74861.1 MAG: NAD(P) transhydrogenase subunit alpha part 1 [Alphaproteobacteria bacterium MarineAlpha4_Bin1]